MRKSHLIVLSLLVLAYSCEKTEPKAKGLFLKQIVYHRNVDQIGQYSYSDDGRLINYQYLFNGKVQDTEDYYYSDGKLSFTKYYSRNLATDPFSLRLTRAYTYDSDTLRGFYHSELQFDYSYSFHYKEGQIDSLSYVIINKIFSDTGRISYKFNLDENGNIIRTIYSYGADYSEKDTIAYEYDNQKNPLYKLTIPPDFISYYSKNNVLKNFNSTFTYEYNSTGLPIKRHENYDDGNGNTSESDIEYVYGEL